jgi:Cof subfamily protein (haloacid dehalogenase superfamily)
MQLSKRTAEAKRVKALAFDLDGTLLLPGAILGERTLTVLATLIRRGIRIIIATGRSTVSAEQYRRQLAVLPSGAEEPGSGPMVCFNGAKVALMPGGKTLGLRLLDPEVVDFCADLSRRAGVYYQAYFTSTQDPDGEFLLTGKDSSEAAGYQNHTGVSHRFGDIRTYLKATDFEGCIKGMFIGEGDALDRLRPILEERFGRTIYLTKSSPTFLEVLAAGVSKGWGLSLAMEHCRLRSDEVIAFGDEENDLPMFGVAGFAVAPANAREEVRDAADLVAGPNTAEGIAAFLTEFFGL